MNLAKMPPNDPEIEKVLLSILLQSPSLITKIVESLNSEDFYSSNHQKIFDKLIELHKRGCDINVTSVTIELKDLASIIIDLEEIPTQGLSLNYYVDSILELSSRRRQIEESTRIIRESFNVTQPFHHVTEKNLSVKIKEWIDSTEGNWNVSQLDRELFITKEKEKSNRRKILSRLREGNYIEKTNCRDDTYKRVNQEENRINWLNADIENEFPLVMPFNIECYVKIYPKNIIIVAGASNAGKTAFLLNIVRMNMMKHQIYYFSSEMGAEELKVRLSNFKDIRLDEWRFTAIERSSEFSALIRPNDLNIIDYLEVYDNFFTIGADIKKIYDKLKGGIAIIALQKKKNEELGRGADFTLEKSRLYVSLDNQKCKIIKAKNWRTDQNPNNKEINFKLVQGCKFIQY